MSIVIMGHQEIREYCHLGSEENHSDWENLALIVTRVMVGVTMVCVLNVRIRIVTVLSR